MPCCAVPYHAVPCGLPPCFGALCNTLLWYAMLCNTKMTASTATIYLPRSSTCVRSLLARKEWALLCLCGFLCFKFCCDLVICSRDLFLQRERPYLEAWAFRLIHIQGLEISAPVIHQLVVVVVVFCGHLGWRVLMWLVHVNHLRMTERSVTLVT